MSSSSGIGAPAATLRSPRVRLSATLSAYLARQALLGFAMALLGLALLALVIDFIELARRASSKPDATLGVVALMSGLHLPLLLQELAPFAVLFGTMLSFHRLSRTHELVAVRAIGVSVWQFLLPSLLLVIGVGTFTVVAFNPFAATLLARYESLDRTYLTSRSAQLAIASGSLWFRQTLDDQELVLHARQMTASSTTLENVVVFIYDGAGTFVARVDAPRGRLLDGQWELEDAVRTHADGRRDAQPRLRIATELTPGQIQESFAPPESLSFWDLPGFIRALEEVGFSAREHQLYWHGLLALPLVLCAMLLIGTSCSLRLARRGGVGVLVAGGLAAGFLFYAFSDLIAAVGLSGRLPATLAAWAPAGVAVLLGVTTLLHIEDG